MARSRADLVEFKEELKPGQLGLTAWLVPHSGSNREPRVLLFENDFEHLRAVDVERARDDFEKALLSALVPEEEDAFSALVCTHALPRIDEEEDFGVGDGWEHEVDVAIRSAMEVFSIMRRQQQRASSSAKAEAKEAEAEASAKEAEEAKAKAEEVEAEAEAEAKAKAKEAEAEAEAKEEAEAEAAREPPSNEEDPMVRARRIRLEGEAALRTVLLAGNEQRDFLLEAIRLLFTMAHPRFLDPLVQVAENHPRNDDDEALDTICVVCYERISAATPLVWTADCCERSLMCNGCFVEYQRTGKEGVAKASRRCVCMAHHPFDARRWAPAGDWFWRRRAAQFLQLREPL